MNEFENRARGGNHGNRFILHQTAFFSVPRFSILFSCVCAQHKQNLAWFSVAFFVVLSPYSHNEHLTFRAKEVIQHFGHIVGPKAAEVLLHV